MSISILLILNRLVLRYRINEGVGIQATNKVNWLKGNWVNQQTNCLRRIKQKHLHLLGLYFLDLYHSFVPANMNAK